VPPLPVVDEFGMPNSPQVAATSPLFFEFDAESMALLAGKLPEPSHRFSSMESQSGMEEAHFEAQRMEERHVDIACSTSAAVTICEAVSSATAATSSISHASPSAAGFPAIPLQISGGETLLESGFVYSATATTSFLRTFPPEIIDLVSTTENRRKKSRGCQISSQDEDKGGDDVQDLDVAATHSSNVKQCRVLVTVTSSSGLKEAYIVLRPEEKVRSCIVNLIMINVIEFQVVAMLDKFL
jgi:hypothetical protein